MNKTQRLKAAQDAVDCEVDPYDRAVAFATMKNAQSVEIGTIITTQDEDHFRDMWKALELAKRLHPELADIILMEHKDLPFSIALVRKPLTEMDDEDNQSSADPHRSSVGELPVCVGSGMA